MTIKEIRASTGLTQKEFAMKYHINLITLQSWEQGRRNPPESILFLLQEAIKDRF